MLGGGEGGSAGSVGSAGSAGSAGSWGVSRFSNAFSSTSTMVSILLTMASFRRFLGRICTLLLDPRWIESHILRA